MGQNNLIMKHTIAAACVELVTDRPETALSLYSVDRGNLDVAIVVARTPLQAKRLRDAFRALDNGAIIGAKLP